MFMIPTIVSLIEVVLVLVPALLAVAYVIVLLVPVLLAVTYVTVAEIKTFFGLFSGFMTEHAAVVFVFFFLAEYEIIVLMCILTSLFFLLGYLAIYRLSLGLKSLITTFVFIWARASFPRIRFDQLMAFCWTVLLPILFAIIIFVPCILFSFDIFPVSVNLF